METNYFLQMISMLRQQEDILLYTNVHTISEDEKESVAVFLEGEYRLEIQEYPFIPPCFNKNAALWAAERVYLAAQLILYRKDEPEDLPLFFPEFTDIQDAGAFLSADLTLRFLPGMLEQLRIIDHEDPLNELLKNLLRKWHYSAVGLFSADFITDLSTIVSNNCVFQLYRNRIIAKKHLQLATHPVFCEQIKADLGIYASTYWKEFNTIITTDEHN